MNVTVTDDAMTGENTTHTARRTYEGINIWEVSWLPGRLPDRNQAISAMVIADFAASTAPRQGDRLWPHIEGWAAELGLTAPDALARAAQPPGDISANRDPEAGR